MTDAPPTAEPPAAPTAADWRPGLAALDIDGTILDHDEQLSERVRKAVQATAEAGTHVVIATGRSLHATLPVLDRLSLLSGWAICANGSVTLRLDPSVETGYEIAHAVTFDATAVITLLREHLPTALYAVEDGSGNFLLTAPFPPGEMEGPHVRVVRDFDELLEKPVARVVVRSPEHTSQDFLELTRAVGLNGVNYAVGWTAWLDLAPEGVSKASALEQVRAELGVPRDRTLAVGDGRNDLEMFAWAHRSVAMGNATEDVLPHADEIAPPVQEDGLAQVLEAVLPRDVPGA